MTRVPRIKIKQPDGLLQSAGARAAELGKHIDELYAEAIDQYIEKTKNASAGSLRSRSAIPRASPQIIVEIPEELFHGPTRSPSACASRATSCTPRRWPGTSSTHRPPTAP